MDELVTVEVGSDHVVVTLLDITTVTAGKDSIQIDDGAAIITVDMVVSLGIMDIEVNKVVVDTDAIYLTGKIWDIDVDIIADVRHRKLVMEVDAGQIANKLSPSPEFTKVMQEIAWPDTGTITISRPDSTTSIYMGMSGTILGIDTYIQIGIVPTLYIMATVDTIDIKRFLDTPVLEGISLRDMSILISDGDVDLDRTYHAGVYMKGAIEIDKSNHSPIMEIPYLLLSSRSEASLDILRDGSWLVYLARLDHTHVATIAGLQLELGMISLKLDSSNNVALTIQVRLTIKDMIRLDGTAGDLTIAGEMNVSITKNGSTTYLKTRLSLYQPIDILDDLSLKSMSLTFNSSTDSPVVSVDALMDLLIPDKVQLQAAIMAWGYPADGEFIMSKDGIAIGLSVQEPTKIVQNLLAIGDDNIISPVLDIIAVRSASVKYSNTDKLGYMRGISLAGHVGITIPPPKYESDKDMDAAIYLVQSVMNAVAGTVDFKLATTIDVATPRNSSASISILIGKEIQILDGYTFHDVEFGIEVKGTPSIGLYAALNMTVPVDNALRFRLGVDFGATNLRGSLSMLGTWNRVFGIPGITVEDLGVALDKSYADLAAVPSLLVPGMNIGTAIKILAPSGAALAGTIGIGPTGIVDKNGDPVPPLKARIELVVTQNVSDMGVAGSLDTSVYSSIAKIVEPAFILFTGGDELPDGLYDAMNFMELKRAGFRVVPMGTTIGDVTIDQGMSFELSAQFNSDVIDGPLMLAGSLDVNEGFKLKGEFPRVDIPGIILIAGHDKIGNPSFNMDISTVSPLDSKIQGEGSITILDTLTEDTIFSISKDGILIDVTRQAGDAYIHYNLGLGFSGIPSISAAIDLDNPSGILANSVDAIATGIKDGIQAIAEGVGDGLNDFIEKADSDYNDRREYYDTLTMDKLDDTIKQCEDNIRDAISDAFQSIISDTTKVSDTTKERDSAIAARDSKEKELNDQLKANGYSNISVQGVQSTIDAKNRAKKEQEKKKAYEMGAKQRALSAIRSKINSLKSQVEPCGVFHGKWGCSFRNGGRWSAIGGLELSYLATKAAPEWLTDAVAKVIDDINKAITAIKSAISWLGSKIRDVWNAVKDVASKAINALVNIIKALGDPASLLRKAKELLDTIITNLTQIVKYKILKASSVLTPITLAKLEPTGIDVPILVMVKDTITAFNAVASYLDINLPFVYEISSVADTIISGMISRAKGVDLPAGINLPIKKRNELHALMSDIESQTKERDAANKEYMDTGSDSSRERYEALYNKVEETQDRIDVLMKESDDAPQLHEPAKDIKIEFKHLYAIVDGGTDELGIIIRYFIAQPLKIISDGLNLMTYNVFTGPSLEGIMDSILSSGDVDTIDIGGIKVPSIGAVSRWVSHSINIHGFHLHGELSKDRQYITLEPGAEIELAGKRYPIPSFSIDFKELLMSIIQRIIDIIVDIFVPV